MFYKSLGLAALLALFMANAVADPIIDDLDIGEDVDWWESVAYEHDLNGYGFDPSTITGGTLEIFIWDDKSGIDEWLGREVVLFTVEEFDFDTGGITLGASFHGELQIEALAALRNDGKLDVKVTSWWGDFYLDKSVLTVYRSVPEPGTLALLGIGLIGMGIARRRKA